jgi:hypothetical protein
MVRSESKMERVARLGLAQQPPHTPPRWVAINFVGGALTGALFPRLTARLRRIEPRSPRALAIRFVLSTLAWLAIDAFMRGMAEAALDREKAEARLRAELGRPPWPEEIDRALR